MRSEDNSTLDLEHSVRRWGRARWIRVFSTLRPKIYEVTECLGLGLSASSSNTKHRIPKFANSNYRNLWLEVAKLVRNVPNERNALLDLAADPQSLDTELEELLKIYGPAIWSKHADRTCLRTPDPTKNTYTKDLFYEEPEHKNILKIHLHRWIIIKGFNRIGKSNVESVNGRKRQSQAAGSFLYGDVHCATPAKRPYITLPIDKRRNSSSGHKHTLPSPANGVEAAKIKLSPLSNNELNITARQQNAPVIAPAGGNNILSVEIHQSVPRAPVVSTAELRIFQCGVTAMLLQWLFPEPSSHPADELALLQRIDSLWYYGESIFRQELGAHYDLTSYILTAWLQERCAIVRLQHALATHPGLPSTSSAIIDRVLAMNDLRVMRLKWKNISPMDGMSPENILIRAFCLITMTEHTEFLFQEGLNRVESNVFEFLRTEDAKIVLHKP